MVALNDVTPVPLLLGDALAHTLLCDDAVREDVGLMEGERLADAALEMDTLFVLLPLTLVLPEEEVEPLRVEAREAVEDELKQSVRLVLEDDVMERDEVTHAVLERVGRLVDEPLKDRVAQGVGVSVTHDEVEGVIAKPVIDGLAVPLSDPTGADAERLVETEEEPQAV